MSFGHFIKPQKTKKGGQLTLDDILGSTERSTKKSRIMDGSDFFTSGNRNNPNAGVPLSSPLNGSNSRMNSAIMAASQPAKKLVIKSFKVKPTLPHDYIDKTMDKLCMAVVAIHSTKAVPDSLEELYKSCEHLCQNQKAPDLFSRLLSLFKSQMATDKEQLQAYVGTDSILDQVKETWDRHLNNMIMIRSIFLYMDRTYLMQTSGLKSLWDTGLDLFRGAIMDDAGIQRSVVHQLLHLILQDRKGEQVPKPLLRSLIRMLQDLSIYFTAFERKLLDASTRFYSDTAAQFVSQFTSTHGGSEIATYIQSVLNAVAAETARCDIMTGYLDLSSKKRLISVVDLEMVEKHVVFILDKGFKDLMDANRLEDLGRLYQVMDRVRALEPLRKHFAAYIKDNGRTLVSDPARDAQMVESILTFKKKLHNIIISSFNSTASFINTIKDAFEDFINTRANKPAEMVAKHIDGLLKTSKGVTEEEIETQLNECLGLFRFIQGKDVFEAFYKKDLARRLLLDRSASIDAEKSMLSKLKNECGPGFTMKLEGMFKDMELSKDIVQSFKEVKGEEMGSLDLSVSVLTDGFWPSFPETPLNLPHSLSKAQESFKAFYQSKHSGRLLKWQNSRGHCVVKADFPKGRKEVSLSLVQTAVLLLFNDSERLSAKEIGDATGIESKELTRTLQSLALSKVRLLERVTSEGPSKKDISLGDVFRVNLSFTNPHFRIKVNAIQAKDTPEERVATTEKVFQDRVYVVDAAIVRIMKTRKSLEHELLLAELIPQLKFQSTTADLKKRIESLIDRDYLERDSENARLYHYVA